MTNKANINDFLNLKVLIIKSLKKQEHKENWMYPTLKNLNIHEIHFNS